VLVYRDNDIFVSIAVINEVAGVLEFKNH